MIYLHTRRFSNGARDIARAIRAAGGRCRHLLGRNDRPWDPDGLHVGWGEGQCWPAPQEARWLNREHNVGKYRELERLSEAEVPVPAFARLRPADSREWLARRFRHQGANDLLAELRTGDYYVEFTPVKYEFRIHIFNGVSIRAGIKCPRTAEPHPRFRSWNAGWYLDYGEACQNRVRQWIRDAAKQAVKALGYDFGAVDIGVKADKTPVVFEVNSAPGLEGNSLDVYGAKIVEYYINDSQYLQRRHYAQYGRGYGAVPGRDMPGMWSGDDVGWQRLGTRLRGMRME